MASKRAAAEAPDWLEQTRRPFRRGFFPYGLDEATTAEQAAKRRKAIGVDLVEDPFGEDSTPAPAASFAALGVLPRWLLDALRFSGKPKPSALEAQALPILLAGQNAVLVSPGGEGGEFASAYLVPAILQVEDQAQLSKEEPGPVVLILTSSDAKASKISDTASTLLATTTTTGACERHPNGLRCVCVSGGGMRSEKLKELTEAGAHIVVGTPKRVNDMAVKGQLSLLRVTTLVMDGADKMFDQAGGADLIRDIAGWIRPERHSIALAANWAKGLRDLAGELCYGGGSPVVVFMSSGEEEEGGVADEGTAAPTLKPKPKMAPASKASAKPKPVMEEFPEDDAW